MRGNTEGQRQPTTVQGIQRAAKAPEPSGRQRKRPRRRSHQSKTTTANAIQARGSVGDDCRDFRRDCGSVDRTSFWKLCKAFRGGLPIFAEFVDWSQGGIGAAKGEYGITAEEESNRKENSAVGSVRRVDIKVREHQLSEGDGGVLESHRDSRPLTYRIATRPKLHCDNP